MFVRERKVLGMLLEEIPDFGFPASPCCHQIKVQDQHGTGMKNRKVYLVIRFMRRRFIKTYITDESGMASFNLDTTAWNSSPVFLEVNTTSAYGKLRILGLYLCPPLLPCSSLPAQAWAHHTALCRAGWQAPSLQPFPNQADDSLTKH